LAIFFGLKWSTLLQFFAVAEQQHCRNSPATATANMNGSVQGSQAY
jgi:hypothetical protein